jgi:hypothetical protein
MNLQSMIKRIVLTNQNKRIIYLLLTVFIISFIFLGFYKGIYIKAIYTNSVAKTFGKSFTSIFNKFQKDSDSLIFSTLIYNKQYPFNNGVMVLLQDSPDNTIRAYKNGDTFSTGHFEEYTSQTGLQNMVYIILDKIIPFSSSVKVGFFYGLNALFSAVTMTAIIIWFSKITNWFIGLGLTIYIAVFDIWIILFAKSVYWVMWTWFLPMLISMILLENYKNKQKYSNITASILIGSAIIIKCLCGFEYITTIIISLTIPYFYYWISMKWKSRDMVNKLLIVLSAAVSGFILSIGIWITQYTIHFRSMSKALDLFSITVFKRIPGNMNVLAKLAAKGADSNTIEIMGESLEASAIRVVWTYIVKPFGPFRYGYVILIVLLFSLTGIFILRKFKIIEEINRNIIGLLVSVWISFIAPISWYILAKGHSYIHTHINFVLWDLPFIFFGIALCLYIICVLLVYFSKSNRLCSLLFKYKIIRK